MGLATYKGLNVLREPLKTSEQPFVFFKACGSRDFNGGLKMFEMESVCVVTLIIFADLI